MLTLEEYQENFINEAEDFGKDITGNGTVAEFTNKFAKELIDAEILFDFTPAFAQKKWKNSNLRLDGYDASNFDVNSSLDLIITDWTPDLNRTITDATSRTLFQKLIVFIKACVNDGNKFIDSFEYDLDAKDIAKQIFFNRNEISKVRLFLFTNAKLSSNIKTINLDPIESISLEAHIWNLKRLYEFNLNENEEKITVDFTKYVPSGISCLEACSEENEGYKSYLAVIPGKALAQIYQDYGSRLLEGNVRSFLSTKVKVNKQIRTTIKKEPKRFFAYNNGIAATTTDAEISRRSDSGTLAIYKATDFQIINGGQTTASLFSASFKDKLPLDDIYVQMKLTVVDTTTKSEDEFNELIANISRSSNSQNKVSEADFFSSHPFHRAIEQLSKLTIAPAKDGSQKDTRWFYERARGQYLQEQMSLTKAQRAQFQIRNPKDQLIKKTDLAKAREIWLEKPHIVSKGAQTNFGVFADDVDKLWQADSNQFNKEYFKESIAILILYKWLEKEIPNCSWYQNGYRANIISYALSFFHHCIDAQYKTYKFNYNEIWKVQDVPLPIQNILLDIAKLVSDQITDPNRKVINVTQWCKRTECWESVKSIKFTLPEDINKFLLSKEEVKELKHEGRMDQKTTSEANLLTKFGRVEYRVWPRLIEFYSSIQNDSIISETEFTILSVMKSYPRKVPSIRQIAKIMQLLSRAEENGFLIEQ